MARKIVVCCDGTWNTPRNETNVFRTYRFLRERLGNPAQTTQKMGGTTGRGHAGEGPGVLLSYAQGIGTDWVSRIIGGAAGVGLSENVRDAYHFLGQSFAPNTSIYVFRFSRGAVTTSEEQQT